MDLNNIVHQELQINVQHILNHLTYGFRNWNFEANPIRVTIKCNLSENSRRINRVGNRVAAAAENAALWK